MKIAPLHRAFQAYPHLEVKLLHTGQHYDANMSGVFFDQLELPAPDHYLGIGSGTHAAQTAHIMLAFEQVLLQEKPDLVVVAGDVNSTLACALTAVKMHIPLAHIEAGLRSGDRSMPEEINRIVTDAVSDYLFVTEESGLRNLQNEGISPEKIFFSGNCMIDSLLFYREKSAKLNLLDSFGFSRGEYVLFTLHRPSNTDTREALESVLDILERIATTYPMIFPLHPRTRQQFKLHNVDSRLNRIVNLHLPEPLGYLEFQYFLSNAGVVLTDSGGVQEESTFVHIPCITLRNNTERPVTIESGTNELLPPGNPELVYEKVQQAMSGAWKAAKVPDLWDGKAAERIAAIIDQKLYSSI